MKKKIFSFLLALIVIATLVPQQSVAGGGSTQYNRPSNVGFEFYITFLPCYIQAGSSNRIMLYIAASDSGSATIEVPGKQAAQTVTLKANDVVPFEFSPMVAQAMNKSEMQSIPPEVVYPAAAIHITSTVPCIVYGVTRFPYTSDSFTALPVESLGSEYVVSSFPDMTGMYGDWSLPSETAIVGAYDGTQVQFIVGGSSVTVTGGGRRMGDTISFTLNKGDVWIVGNNAQSKEGDMTGSVIHASLPVAVFSGNQCANVPTKTPWCDFIDEQEMPRESWGNHYLLPRYQSRTYGYYMRMMAGADNCVVERDGLFWKTIPTVGGAENSGWIYQRASATSDVVSYRSQSPFNVVLFNPGQSDDNVSTDPFQMNVMPWEQFVNTCIFCTPGSKGGIGFTKNYLGVVFPLDANGEVPENVEFGTSNGKTIDWQPLRTAFGSAVSQKDVYRDTMPNGRVYAYKECALKGDNVYALRCPDRIMAYVYGGSDYDSYGNPAGGLAIDMLRSNDKNNPGIVVKKGQGSWSGSVVDYPSDQKTRSNISKVLLQPGSSNLRLTAPRLLGKSTASLDWTVQVVDPSKDAHGVFTVCDRAGNDSSVTFIYSAQSALNPVISSSAGSSACQGTTVVLTCEGDFSTYLWSTGETTKSISVELHALEPRSFWVKATNAKGEQFTSETFHLSVIVAPVKPEITQSLNTLNSSVEGVAYQWYANGSVIAGATQRSYTMSTTSNYQVEVFNQYGCTAKSDSYAGVVAGIEEELATGMSLSPNPARTEAILSYGPTKPTLVEVFDTDGKRNMSFAAEVLPDNSLRMNVRDLSAGSYTIRIHMTNRVLSLRFIKE